MQARPPCRRACAPFLFGPAPKTGTGAIHRLRQAEHDMVRVAAARAAANLVLAFGPAAVHWPVPVLRGAVGRGVRDLTNFFHINTMLETFNMSSQLLDGCRIAVDPLSLNPTRPPVRPERHELFILIGLIIILRTLTGSSTATSLRFRSARRPGS